MSDLEMKELLKSIQGEVRRVHHRMDEKSLLETRLEEVAATVARIEAKLEIRERTEARHDARIVELERWRGDVERRLDELTEAKP
jgi:hypothetical protein